MRLSLRRYSFQLFVQHPFKLLEISDDLQKAFLYVDYIYRYRVLEL